MMRLGFCLLLVVVVLAGCGGSGREGDVVATVGDHPITREFLHQRLSEMPPRVQDEFSSEEGMKKLLDGIIDEEAFYLAALDMNLEENAEVKRLIESAHRRVLIQSYYTREIAPFTKMTEEDMRTFYEENLDLFTKPVESEVRQVVLGSRADAERVRGMLVNGANWERIVQEHCVDKLTKDRKGRMGPVQVNSGIIPLVGTSSEMSEIIDTLTVGTVSPIVETGKGFHILTVDQRHPEEVLPFEKAQRTIQAQHGPEFAEKVRKEKAGLLREKYGVQILKDPTPEVAVDPEEEGKAARSAAKLFELAQSSTQPMDRIKYYDEIVRNYSDDEHACEAQFMIGFVYSEELHNYDLAREAFLKVMERKETCDGELVQSAEWMLENMGTEPPPFEEP